MILVASHISNTMAAASEDQADLSHVLAAVDDDFTELKNVLSFVKAVYEDNLLLYTVVLYVCYRVVSICCQCYQCRNMEAWLLAAPASSPGARSLTSSQNCTINNSDPPPSGPNLKAGVSCSTTCAKYPIDAPCITTCVITIDPHEDAPPSYQQSTTNSPSCVYGTQ